VAHRRRGEVGCGSRRWSVRWCNDLNQRRGGGLPETTLDGGRQNEG
jgi:hypothetical protein